MNKKKLFIKNLIPLYIIFLLWNCTQAQQGVNTILAEANVEIPRLSPIPEKERA